MSTALLLAALTLVPAPQEEGWREPPEEITRILTAEPTPRASLSPDGRLMLLVERDAMPDLSELARPMLKLAGTRIDPDTNGRHQAYLSHTLVIRRVGGGDEKRFEAPEGTRIGDTSWSHTSEHLAFTLVGGSDISLYVLEVGPGTVRRVLTGLNGAMGGFQWMPDGTRLLCNAVAPQRGEAPVEPAVPPGPAVQETRGTSTPVRTYQDLLEDPHDEALFDYYMTSQLVLVDAAGGTPERVGAPAVFAGVSVAPDGEHLLVTRIERPYSYLQPYYRFPRRIEVWHLDGEVVHTVANKPLAAGIPLGGVETGPRSVQWRPDAPHTLLWLEALDGGDPKREVSHRDVWKEHEVHGDGGVREVLATEFRARGVTFVEGGSLAMFSESDRKTRRVRTTLVDWDEPSEARVVDDRNSRDAYSDPGRPVTTHNAAGERVIRRDGDAVFLSGRGASPAGYRPFLDRMDLETGRTERLWQCDDESYETFVSFAGAPGMFITRRETQTYPPNYGLRRAGSDDWVGLTNFEDPHPQLSGIQKRLVRYERSDGVPLSATLYLPPGYQEGTKLPLVVWAYPLEYNDAQTAGQVRTTEHRFTRLGGTSHLFFLTQGYAVMDGATMPVIGDPETMNDSFIEQIVDAAEAAVAEAVELGVSDGRRVGVGGHSYGAFMTANLLAHSDVFQAGIARSGAYNRTLTPFGFQSERRTVWEAPEVYFRVSPFMHAHTLDEPILLIHGDADNNSGTFPIQSERLFHALKGNGGTARLVQLPYEGHGYRGRQSVLHCLAEMIAWFDEHVKGEDGVREASFGR